MYVLVLQGLSCAGCVIDFVQGNKTPEFEYPDGTLILNVIDLCVGVETSPNLIGVVVSIIPTVESPVFIVPSV